MKSFLIVPFSALLMASLTLFGCSGDNGGENGGWGNKTEKEEFTYITVDYQRKSNGTYPNGWESSLSKQTLLVSNMNWMDKKDSYQLDEWGGNPSLKVSNVISSNPSGFWRTGKVGDRWYFINPSGNATVLHGLNNVVPVVCRDVCTQESLDAYNMIFDGDVHKWAQYAGEEILDKYDFNFFSVSPRRTVYYWQYMDDDATQTLRSPSAGVSNCQVENLFLLRTFSWNYNSIYHVSFSTDQYNIFVLLFDPKYLESIDAYAEEATTPFKNSKNIIGYYTDNELPFNSYQNKYPLKGIELQHFLTLEDKFDGQFDGARNFAKNFMTDNYGVEPTVVNITEEMRTKFRYEVARYYYKTVTEAIRRYDQNHLILGSRLFDSSMYNEYTVKACAEYCDVVSVNYYNYWQPQTSYCIDQLKAWLSDSKPFMVTEFYVKDAGAKYINTVYENLEGAGWLVRDQKSRGYYYQNFCINLLKMKNCVGWQWFEFMDSYGNSTSDTMYKGSNKGVVSARFEPYEDCLELMREMHWNIYQVTDYFDK